MREPLLHVDVQASYGDKVVLRDIRFDLHAGESLGLVGSSGAGKSTIAMALLGLLHWRGGKVSGEVMLEGKNLLAMRESEARKVRGRRVALIPQSPMTALNGVVSLRTHFEEAWSAHERGGRAMLDQRLALLLGGLQIPSDKKFLARRPDEISVGQAQRVMIALALLHQPSVLIADEPTSALDPINQAEFVRLLRRTVRETQTALLYISHDLMSVLQMCQRLAVLDAGAIVERLAVEDLEKAQHPATRCLLAALPVPPHVLLAYRGGDPIEERES